MENDVKLSFLYGTVSTFVVAGIAAAEVPSVAVDIPPVYALAAKVMEGVGQPNLIIQIGASPHGYSLRPSEAVALQNADIIFWVSEGLTPWLERSIESLAPDTNSVELLETEGTTELEFREGVAFEEDENGKHKIIAKRYGQTTNARYGLNQDEFETRKPAYFPNLNKYKRIKKDLERMLRLPNLGR